MKRCRACILILALFVSSGCTTMRFSGEDSVAESLEMSDVNDSQGISFNCDDFDDRGFYLLGIVPISEPNMGKSIGFCKDANSISITTEDDAIDYLFGYLTGGWVSSRRVEVKGLKTVR